MIWLIDGPLIKKHPISNYVLQFMFNYNFSWKWFFQLQIIF
jgi:hypothetical protein